MPGIPNLERFPFNIRQNDENSCIPASIEAVTKYFLPDSHITQKDIWRRFEENNRTEPMSFASVKKLVLDTDSAFSPVKAECHKLVFPDSLDWVLQTVTSKPVIVSLPARYYSGAWTGKWHMITILGYDDDVFHVYDPDPLAILPYDVPINGLEHDLFSLVGRRETDALVISPVSSC